MNGTDLVLNPANIWFPGNIYYQLINQPDTTGDQASYCDSGTGSVPATVMELIRRLSEVAHTQVISVMALGITMLIVIVAFIVSRARA